MMSLSNLQTVLFFSLLLVSHATTKFNNHQINSCNINEKSLKFSTDGTTGKFALTSNTRTAAPGSTITLTLENSNAAIHDFMVHCAENSLNSHNAIKFTGNFKTNHIVETALCDGVRQPAAVKRASNSTTPLSRHINLPLTVPGDFTGALNCYAYASSHSKTGNSWYGENPHIGTTIVVRNKPVVNSKKAIKAKTQITTTFTTNEQTYTSGAVSWGRRSNGAFVNSGINWSTASNLCQNGGNFTDSTDAMFPVRGGWNTGVMRFESEDDVWAFQVDYFTTFNTETTVTLWVGLQGGASQWDSGAVWNLETTFLPEGWEEADDTMCAKFSIDNGANTYTYEMVPCTEELTELVCASVITCNRPYYTPTLAAIGSAGTWTVGEDFNCSPYSLSDDNGVCLVLRSDASDVCNTFREVCEYVEYVSWEYAIHAYGYPGELSDWSSADVLLARLSTSVEDTDFDSTSAVPFYSCQRQHYRPCTPDGEVVAAVQAKCQSSDVLYADVANEGEYWDDDIRDSLNVKWFEGCGDTACLFNLYDPQAGGWTYDAGNKAWNHNAACVPNGEDIADLAVYCRCMGEYGVHMPPRRNTREGMVAARGCSAGNHQYDHFTVDNVKYFYPATTYDGDLQTSLAADMWHDCGSVCVYDYCQPDQEAWFFQSSKPSVAPNDKYYKVGPALGNQQLCFVDLAAEQTVVQQRLWDNANCGRLDIWTGVEDTSGLSAFTMWISQGTDTSTLTDLQSESQTISSVKVNCPREDFVISFTASTATSGVSFGFEIRGLPNSIVSDPNYGTSAQWKCTSADPATLDASWKTDAHFDDSAWVTIGNVFLATDTVSLAPLVGLESFVHGSCRMVVYANACGKPLYAGSFPYKGAWGDCWNAKPGDACTLSCYTSIGDSYIHDGISVATCSSAGYWDNDQQSCRRQNFCPKGWTFHASRRGEPFPCKESLVDADKRCVVPYDIAWELCKDYDGQCRYVSHFVDDDMEIFALHPDIEPVELGTDPIINDEESDGWNACERPVTKWTKFFSCESTAFEFNVPYTELSRLLPSAQRIKVQHTCGYSADFDLTSRYKIINMNGEYEDESPIIPALLENEAENTLTQRGDTDAANYWAGTDHAVNTITPSKLCTNLDTVDNPISRGIFFEYCAPSKNGLRIVAGEICEWVGSQFPGTEFQQGISLYVDVERDFSVRTAYMTALNTFTLYSNGVEILTGGPGTSGDPAVAHTTSFEADQSSPTVLAVVASKDGTSVPAFLGSFDGWASTVETEPFSWKCIDASKFTSTDDWKLLAFDDTNWDRAESFATANTGNGFFDKIDEISLSAQWLWAAGKPNTVYCRTVVRPSSEAHVQGVTSQFGAGGFNVWVEGVQQTDSEVQQRPNEYDALTNNLVYDALDILLVTINIHVEDTDTAVVVETSDPSVDSVLVFIDTWPRGVVSSSAALGGWKCIASSQVSGGAAAASQLSYDDSAWSLPVAVSTNGVDGQQKTAQAIEELPLDAEWIQPAGVSGEIFMCRTVLGPAFPEEDVPECPCKAELCHGECIFIEDYQFDSDNCGWCGNACAATQRCLNGQCVADRWTKVFSCDSSGAGHWHVPRWEVQAMALTAHRVRFSTEDSFSVTLDELHPEIMDETMDTYFGAGRPASTNENLELVTRKFWVGTDESLAHIPKRVHNPGCSALPDKTWADGQWFYGCGTDGHLHIDTASNMCSWDKITNTQIDVYLDVDRTVCAEAPVHDWFAPDVTWENMDHPLDIEECGREARARYGAADVVAVSVAVVGDNNKCYIDLLSVGGVAAYTGTTSSYACRTRPVMPTVAWSFEGDASSKMREFAHADTLNAPYGVELTLAPIPASGTVEYQLFYQYHGSVTELEGSVAVEVIRTPHITYTEDTLLFKFEDGYGRECSGTLPLGSTSAATQETKLHWYVDKYDQFWGLDNWWTACNLDATMGPVDQVEDVTLGAYFMTSDGGIVKKAAFFQGAPHDLPAYQWVSRMPGSHPHWHTAADACAAQGARLCYSQEICPFGKGSIPVFGLGFGTPDVQAVPDEVYLPVMDNIRGYVQIGYGDADGRPRDTCFRPDESTNILFVDVDKVGGWYPWICCGTYSNRAILGNDIWNAGNVDAGQAEDWCELSGNALWADTSAVPGCETDRKHKEPMDPFLIDVDDRLSFSAQFGACTGSNAGACWDFTGWTAVAHTSYFTPVEHGWFGVGISDMCALRDDLTHAIPQGEGTMIACAPEEVYLCSNGLREGLLLTSNGQRTQHGTVSTLLSHDRQLQACAQQAIDNGVVFGTGATGVVVDETNGNCYATEYDTDWPGYDLSTGNWISCIGESPECNWALHGKMTASAMNTNRPSCVWPNWCSPTQGIGEWVQIQFDDISRINQVGIRGYEAANEWVTKYNLWYRWTKAEITDDWRQYGTFDGSADAAGLAITKLKDPLYTDCVRFQVEEFHDWASMRVYVWGCELNHEEGIFECDGTTFKMLKSYTEMRALATQTFSVIKIEQADSGRELVSEEEAAPLTNLIANDELNAGWSYTGSNGEHVEELWDLEHSVGVSPADYSNLFDRQCITEASNSVQNYPFLGDFWRSCITAANGGLQISQTDNICSWGGNTNKITISLTNPEGDLIKDFCPKGYQLHEATRGSDFWCPESLVKGSRCILPVEDAFEYCNRQGHHCTGVDATKWDGYPEALMDVEGLLPGVGGTDAWEMAVLTRAPFVEDEHWHSCVKDPVPVSFPESSVYWKCAGVSCLQAFMPTSVWTVAALNHWVTVYFTVPVKLYSVQYQAAPGINAHVQIVITGQTPKNGKPAPQWTYDFIDEPSRLIVHQELSAGPVGVEAIFNFPDMGDSGSDLFLSGPFFVDHVIFYGTPWIPAASARGSRHCDLNGRWSDSKAGTVDGLIKAHHTIDFLSQEIVFEWEGSSQSGDWVRAGVEYVAYNPTDGSMWLRSVRHYTRQLNVPTQKPFRTVELAKVEHGCDTITWYRDGRAWEAWHREDSEGFHDPEDPIVEGRVNGDDYFQFYAGGELIFDGSESPEASIEAVRFQYDADEPLVFAIHGIDTDKAFSGVIGSWTGFTGRTGEVIVTGNRWKCADSLPQLDAAGHDWLSAEYDDSNWDPALISPGNNVHTAGISTNAAWIWTDKPAQTDEVWCRWKQKVPPIDCVVGDIAPCTRFNPVWHGTATCANGYWDTAVCPSNPPGSGSSGSSGSGGPAPTNDQWIRVVTCFEEFSANTNIRASDISTFGAGIPYETLKEWVSNGWVGKIRVTNAGGIVGTFGSTSASDGVSDLTPAGNATPLFSLETKEGSYVFDNILEDKPLSSYPLGADLSAHWDGSTQVLPGSSGCGSGTLSGGMWFEQCGVNGLIVDSSPRCSLNGDTVHIVIDVLLRDSSPYLAMCNVVPTITHTGSNTCSNADFSFCFNSFTATVTWSYDHPVIISQFIFQLRDPTQAISTSLKVKAVGSDDLVPIENIKDPIVGTSDVDFIGKAPIAIGIDNAVTEVSLTIVFFEPFSTTSPQFAFNAKPVACSGEPEDLLRKSGMLSEGEWVPIFSCDQDIPGGPAQNWHYNWETIQGWAACGRLSQLRITGAAWTGSEFESEVTAYSLPGSYVVNNIVNNIPLSASADIEEAWFEPFNTPKTLVDNNNNNPSFCSAPLSHGYWFESCVHSRSLWTITPTSCSPGQTTIWARITSEVPGACEEELDRGHCSETLPYSVLPFTAGAPGDECRNVLGCRDVCVKGTQFVSDIDLVVPSMVRGFKVGFQTPTGCADIDLIFRVEYWDMEDATWETIHNTQHEGTGQIFSVNTYTADSNLPVSDTMKHMFKEAVMTTKIRFTFPIDVALRGFSPWIIGCPVEMEKPDNDVCEEDYPLTARYWQSNMAENADNHECDSSQQGGQWCVDGTNVGVPTPTSKLHTLVGHQQYGELQLSLSWPMFVSKLRLAGPMTPTPTYVSQLSVSVWDATVKEWRTSVVDTPGFVGGKERWVHINTVTDHIKIVPEEIFNVDGLRPAVRAWVYGCPAPAGPWQKAWSCGLRGAAWHMQYRDVVDKAQTSQRVKITPSSGDDDWYTVVSEKLAYPTSNLIQGQRILSYPLGTDAAPADSWIAETKKAKDRLFTVRGSFCGRQPSEFKIQDGDWYYACGNDQGIHIFDGMCSWNKPHEGERPDEISIFIDPQGESEGCWQDALEPDFSDEMTWQVYPKLGITNCLEACREGHYDYAGLQFGVQCYCGDDFGRYGRTDTCTLDCPADNQAICGGKWSNYVFQVLPKYKQRCVKTPPGKWNDGYGCSNAPHDAHCYIHCDDGTPSGPYAECDDGEWKHVPTCSVPPLVTAPERISPNRWQVRLEFGYTSSWNTPCGETTQVDNNHLEGHFTSFLAAVAPEIVTPWYKWWYVGTTCPANNIWATLVIGGIEESTATSLATALSGALGSQDPTFQTLVVSTGLMAITTSIAEIDYRDLTVGTCHIMFYSIENVLSVGCCDEDSEMVKNYDPNWPADVRNAIAMNMWAHCDARCLYDFETPEKKAWRWTQNSQGKWYWEPARNSQDPCFTTYAHQLDWVLEHREDLCENFEQHSYARGHFQQNWAGTSIADCQTSSGPIGVSPSIVFQILSGVFPGADQKKVRILDDGCHDSILSFRVDFGPFTPERATWWKEEVESNTAFPGALSNVLTALIKTEVIPPTKHKLRVDIQQDNNGDANNCVHPSGAPVAVDADAFAFILGGIFPELVGIVNVVDDGCVNNILSFHVELGYFDAEGIKYWHAEATGDDLVFTLAFIDAVIVDTHILPPLPEPMSGTQPGHDDHHEREPPTNGYIDWIGVAGWHEAAQYCDSIGRRLCLHREYCPNGENHAPGMGGAESDDEVWAPIGDRVNDWVQVSQSEDDMECWKHSSHFPIPIWGENSAFPTDKPTRFRCCAQYAVYNDDIFGWDGAYDACIDINKRLCYHEEVCTDEHEDNEVPTGGLIPGDGQIWGPMLDKHNDWTQVSTADPRYCMLYSELSSSSASGPSWGFLSGFPQNEATVYQCCAKRRLQCAAGWVPKPRSIGADIVCAQTLITGRCVIPIYDASSAFTVCRETIGCDMVYFSESAIIMGNGGVPLSNEVLYAVLANTGTNGDFIEHSDDFDGCVPAATCTVGDQVYQPGQAFAEFDGEGCSTCECTFEGEVVCSAEKCPRFEVVAKLVKVHSDKEECERTLGATGDLIGTYLSIFDSAVVHAIPDPYVRPHHAECSEAGVSTVEIEVGPFRRHRADDNLEELKKWPIGADEQASEFFMRPVVPDPIQVRFSLKQKRLDSCDEQINEASIFTALNAFSNIVIPNPAFVRLSDEVGCMEDVENPGEFYKTFDLVIGQLTAEPALSLKNYLFVENFDFRAFLGSENIVVENAFVEEEKFAPPKPDDIQRTVWVNAMSCFEGDSSFQVQGFPASVIKKLAATNRLVQVRIRHPNAANQQKSDWIIESVPGSYVVGNLAEAKILSFHDGTPGTPSAAWTGNTELVPAQAECTVAHPSLQSGGFVPRERAPGNGGWFASCGLAPAGIEIWANTFDSVFSVPNRCHVNGQPTEIVVDVKVLVDEVSREDEVLSQISCTDPVEGTFTTNVPVDPACNLARTGVFCPVGSTFPDAVPMVKFTADTTITQGQPIRFTQVGIAGVARSNVGRTGEYPTRIAFDASVVNGAAGLGGLWADNAERRYTLTSDGGAATVTTTVEITAAIWVGKPSFKATVYGCPSVELECPLGQKQCGFECVDQHDNNHCGACYNECERSVCLAGKCSVCSVGQQACGGICIQFNDRRHCGSCGNECDTDEQCLAGRCRGIQYKNDKGKLNWVQANEFCENKGQRLCAFMEYCPSGENSEPAIGFAEGESTVWAPVSDSDNDWVQIGENDAARHCWRYSNHYRAPLWGERGGFPRDQDTTFRCCGGVFVQTEKLNWEGAKSRCTDAGLRLCDADEYCEVVGLNKDAYLVTGGNIFGTDVWAPSGDSRNDWVQVADKARDKCWRHNNHFEAPDWGEEAGNPEYLPTPYQCCSRFQPVCPEGWTYEESVIGRDIWCEETLIPGKCVVPIDRAVSLCEELGIRCNGFDVTEFGPWQKLTPGVFAAALRAEPYKVDEDSIWGSCKKPFFVQQGIFSWGGATEYCQKRGMRLCMAQEYCPGGPGTAPINGQVLTNTAKFSSVFAPISDEKNDWVEVAAGDTLCEKYSEQPGSQRPFPSGIDTGAKDTFFSCCPKEDVKCPEGWESVDGTGWDIEECPGTLIPGACVLPVADAFDRCRELGTRCESVDFTDHGPWQSQTPVKSAALRMGPFTKPALIKWTACVKTPACPVGWTWDEGRQGHNMDCEQYNMVPAPEGQHWCIVPREGAIELCASLPECQSVDHVNTHVLPDWQAIDSSYEMVALRRGPFSANAAWNGCRKHTPIRASISSTKGYTLYANGMKIGERSVQETTEATPEVLDAYDFTLPIFRDTVIAFRGSRFNAKNSDDYGVILSLTGFPEDVFSTIQAANLGWRCTNVRPAFANWSEPGYDDSQWEEPVLAANGNGDVPVVFDDFQKPHELSKSARWIWDTDFEEQNVWCRLQLDGYADTYEVEGLKTWTQARDFCESKPNSRLCSISELCPNGKGTLPVGGLVPGVNIFAPINNAANTWVKVKASKPNVDIDDSCSRRSFKGDPSFAGGFDGNTFFKCCDASTRGISDEEYVWEWEYEGCFFEKAEDRDLPDFDATLTIEPANSITICARACGTLGFNYFGLMLTHECRCGTTFSAKHGASPNACVFPCPTDRSQICGGIRSQSVFKVVRGPLLEELPPSVDIQCVTPDTTSRCEDIDANRFESGSATCNKFNPIYPNRIYWDISGCVSICGSDDFKPCSEISGFEDFGDNAACVNGVFDTSTCRRRECEPGERRNCFVVGNPLWEDESSDIRGALCNEHGFWDLRNCIGDGVPQCIPAFVGENSETVECSSLDNGAEAPLMLRGVVGCLANAQWNQPGCDRCDCREDQKGTREKCGNIYPDSFNKGFARCRDGCHYDLTNCKERDCPCKQPGAPQSKSCVEIDQHKYDSGLAPCGTCDYDVGTCPEKTCDKGCTPEKIDKKKACTKIDADVWQRGTARCDGCQYDTTDCIPNPVLCECRIVGRVDCDTIDPDSRLVSPWGSGTTRCDGCFYDRSNCLYREPECAPGVDTKRCSSFNEFWLKEERAACVRGRWDFSACSKPVEPCNGKKSISCRLLASFGPKFAGRAQCDGNKNTGNFDISECNLRRYVNADP